LRLSLSQLERPPNTTSERANRVRGYTGNDKIRGRIKIKRTP